MKKYLVGFALLLMPSNALLAGSWRLSRAPRMSSAEIESVVSRQAQRYGVDLGNSSYRDLLYAAAANDQRILYYKDDPARGGRIYPTNVLSAASAISMAVNGEAAEVTQILRHMLYYSN